MDFEQIYAINVNDKIEKKGNMNYLSWAFAWAEFKKIYSNAEYHVNTFDGTFCSGNEKIGYMVQTSVTAGDQTYEMWLPVMDSKNSTILQPKMTEINKAIMRCLTKNLAMFGLGLYIYAGEDLPEQADDKGEFEPITREELQDVWGVKQIDENIAWFESKLGLPIAKWGAEECEAVRALLESKKKKREAQQVEEYPFKVEN